MHFSNLNSSIFRSLKQSSYLNLLYKWHSTRGMNKTKAIEYIKGKLNNKDLNTDQMYNFYESWLQIDPKMVFRYFKLSY